MKPSRDLIHSPKTGDEGECLRCGHKCHCGDACVDNACGCGKCVHDPAELAEDDPIN